MKQSARKKRSNVTVVSPATEKRHQRPKHSPVSNQKQKRSKDQVSEAALRMRLHRQRLKEDPQKYQEYLEKERHRSVNRRKQELTPEQKEKVLEQSRIRSRRYYANLKKNGKLPSKKKAKTRKEVKTVREYWKQKKRESRARLGPQKKRRIKETDRKRKMHTHDTGSNKKMKIDKVLSPSPFKSNSSKRKAASRIRQAAPKNPQKFAAAIQALISNVSPRKRQALEDVGVSTVCAKRKLVMEETAQALKSTLRVRANNKKERTQKRNIVKRLMSHYSNIKTATAGLGVRKNYLLKCSAILDTEASYTENKLGTESAMHSLEDEVRDFYVQPDVSVELPDSRKVKNNESCHILQRTIRDTHRLFKEHHPETNIGKSKFAQLRPANVKTQDKNKWNQCLCEYCTNIELKLRTLAKYAGTIEIKAFCNNKFNAVDATLCPKSEGSHFHPMVCIQRKCALCGVDKLHKKLAHLSSEKNVEWYRWGKTSADGDNQHHGLIHVSGTISQLIEELCDELHMMSSHLFNAKWQHLQFKLLLSSMQDEEVVMILDFGMNYSCVLQDESQMSHWYHEQVTVHPIVCFYRCPSDKQLVREELVFLSSDNTHDSAAVSVFFKEAMQHLQMKRKVRISHIYQFTDGCSAQYKSKGPFQEIAKSYQGISITRSFFGSRHGKGPCDGVIGIVKSFVRNAVKARRTVVRNSYEMFEFCKKTLTDDTTENITAYEKLKAEDEMKAKRQSAEEELKAEKTNSDEELKAEREKIGKELKLEKKNSDEELKAERENSGKILKAEKKNLDEELKAASMDLGEGLKVEKEISAANACKHKRRIFFHITGINHKNKVKAKTVAGTRSLHCVSTTGSHSGRELLLRTRNLSCFCDFCHLGISGEGCKNVQYVNDWKTVDLLTGKYLMEERQGAGELEPEESDINASTSDFPTSSVTPPDKKSSSQSRSERKSSQFPMAMEHLDYLQIQQQLEACSSFPEYQNMATQIEENLPKLQPFQSSVLQDVPQHIIDKLALQLMPVTQDGDQPYYPVMIKADGNCLPRTASVLAYGNEEHHVEMRDRIAIELAANFDWYMNESHEIAGRYAMYSAYFFQGERADERTAAIVLQREIMQIAHDAEYMGVWQVWALASVLERPLISMYPEKSPKVREDLHRTFFPRHCQTEIPVRILWSSTHEKHKFWVPNHFVPVIPMQSTETRETEPDFGESGDIFPDLNLIDTSFQWLIDEVLEYTKDSVGELDAAIESLGQELQAERDKSGKELIACNSDKELKTEKVNSGKDPKAEKENSDNTLKAEKEDTGKELRTEKENLDEALKTEKENTGKELKAEKENLDEELKAEKGNLGIEPRAAKKNSVEKLVAERDKSGEELKAEGGNLGKELMAVVENSEDNSGEEPKVENENSSRELMAERENSGKGLMAEIDNSGEEPKVEGGNSSMKLMAECRNSGENLDEKPNPEKENSDEEPKAERGKSVKELMAESGNTGEEPKPERGKSVKELMVESGNSGENFGEEPKVEKDNSDEELKGERGKSVKGMMVESGNSGENSSEEPNPEKENSNEPKVERGKSVKKMIAESGNSVENLSEEPNPEKENSDEPKVERGKSVKEMMAENGNSGENLGEEPKAENENSDKEPKAQRMKSVKELMAESGNSGENLGEGPKAEKDNSDEEPKVVRGKSVKEMMAETVNSDEQLMADREQGTASDLGVGRTGNQK